MLETRCLHNSDPKQRAESTEVDCVAERDKITGGQMPGRSPACGTSALSDGLGLLIVTVADQLNDGLQPSMNNPDLDAKAD